jgi:hypothetical protein
MRRYSFSIRGLMSVVVILALAFAALRTPSRIWANAWFSLALSGLTVAIPGAVATVEDRRAFWVGFAAFGWVYFAFTLAPWVDKEASHQLLSTTILDIASPYIVDNRYLARTYMQSINPPSSPAEPTAWQAWNLPDFQATDSWRIGYVKLHSPFLFLRIGHAVFCLLGAVVGGELARYLYIAHHHAPAGPPPGDRLSTPVPDLSSHPKKPEYPAYPLSWRASLSKYRRVRPSGAPRTKRYPASATGLSQPRRTGPSC